MAIDWASGGGETADPRVQAAAGGFGGVTGVGQGQPRPAAAPEFWTQANALTARLTGQAGQAPVQTNQYVPGAVPGTPSSAYDLWQSLPGTPYGPTAGAEMAASVPMAAPAGAPSQGAFGSTGTPAWAGSLPPLPGMTPSAVEGGTPAAPASAPAPGATPTGQPLWMTGDALGGQPMLATRQTWQGIGPAGTPEGAKAPAPVYPGPGVADASNPAYLMWVRERYGDAAGPIPAPTNPGNPAYGPDGVLGLDDLGHPGLTDTDRYYLAGLAYTQNPTDPAARQNYETWKAAMTPPATPADAPRGTQYGPNQQLGLEDLGLTTLTNQDRHYLAWLAYAQNPGDPAAKANFDTWEAAMKGPAGQPAPAPAGPAAAAPGPSRATLAGMAQDYLYQGGSLINQPYTGPMFTPTTGPYSATFSWEDPRDPANAALHTGQVGPGQSLSAYHTFNPNTQRALQNSIAAGRGGFLLPEDFVHDVDVNDPVAQARWRNSTFGYSYGDPGAAGGALVPGQDASQDAA